MTKLANPRKNVTVRLDERLDTKLGILLYDPVAGRAAYGAKSALVETLLERLLDSIESGASTIDITDLRDAMQLNLKRAQEAMQ